VNTASVISVASVDDESEEFELVEDVAAHETKKRVTNNERIDVNFNCFIIKLKHRSIGFIMFY
tara:strand:- start:930 stop:1118 length:189 start_codon:yes stop_codon:yes gene_type:complete